jgi:hypothetical protein
MISSELHSTPVVVRSILSKKEAGWWFWSCDFLWFSILYIYIYIVYVYNVYIYICMYIFLMFFQKSRWHAFETSKQRTLGWDQIPPGSSGDDRAWGIVFNGNGEHFVGGETQGNWDNSNAGDWDILLIKYGASGTKDWVTSCPIQQT